MHFIRSMRFQKISWKNIEFSKFTIFLVKILDLMHFQALSYDFMKKYWIFNVHYFSSSDVGFNAFSSVFIQFHEQILNFQSSLFFQFGCWVQVYFTNKYWIFKVQSFSSSDLRFNALSSASIRFHEKILNFQCSLFFQFRCWVQYIFKRFHTIS